MNHTLERHKFFPVISWVTIFLLAVLTLLLSIRLNSSIEKLNNSSDVRGEKIRQAESL